MHRFLGGATEPVVSHKVFPFLVELILDVLFIGAAVDRCRVLLRVKILTFPVSPDKPPCFLKLTGAHEVLLLALKLRLDPGAGLPPLVHDLLTFLLRSFVLQLTVLLLPPEVLKSALVQPVRRVVVHKTGSGFEPIFVSVLNFLRWVLALVNAVERTVGLSPN